MVEGLKFERWDDVWLLLFGLSWVLEDETFYAILSFCKSNESEHIRVGMC